MGQPWISADFGQLGDLQQTVSQTATGIDGEHQTWTAQANALAEAWPDEAGMNFQELNAAAVDFDRVNNEFLALLGGAVGKANIIYQDALAHAKAAVLG